MSFAPHLRRLACVMLFFAVSAPSHAAEAFLCGPDNVVYVEPADLPLKKKTDPCIAAFFGLKVEAPAAKPAPLGPTAKTLSPKSRVRTAKAKLELKTIAADSSPDASPVRQAALAPDLPLVAAPGTDYRNVRIINAQPGEPDIFVHEK